jgi:7-cyano-7-deazaguanine synthase in queuosine biosynthesis
MITAADIQTIRNNDPGAVLPGIDTMTGNPYAASALLDVTKITQKTTAPYYYSPSRNAVIVNQAGAVLSGINFGDATVLIQANNVTIKDCTFADTTGFWAVAQNTGISGATVENCTFTGSKSPTESTVWIASQLGITIEDNTFRNSPADSIAIQQRRRRRQLLLR